MTERREMSEYSRQSSLVEAREVWRTAGSGTLSVIDSETGFPLGALVNVAVTPGYEPIILTSTLSRHTQCLDRDGRASVMVTGDLPAQGDVLTGFRATLTGTMARTNDRLVRETFLARHPYAALYADFADFGFWLMVPSRLYLVAGFGRVHNFDASELAVDQG
jgi:putative heme iron utilization protein